MGNFVSLSSIQQRFDKTKEKLHRHRLTNEDKITYRVLYDSSADLESSVWTTIKSRRKHHKQTNRVRTTRYNILTFLPKNLFEQFHRFANIYFAILIGLNWVPVINAISKTVNRDVFYRKIFYQ